MLPSTPYLLLKPANVVAAVGDAAQTTAFLARTSGLSGTETSAYKALINGLVSDGDFASLDVLYIFATNTQTTALLNLVSTSFTATISGTPTFTVDTGFKANLSGTDILQTGFIPSSAGGNYTLNSASYGYYDLTSSTAADSSAGMGTIVGSDSLIIINQGGSTFVDVNDASFPSITALNHQGMYIATRTAASGAGAVNGYKNSSGTPFLTGTGASSSLPTGQFFVLGASTTQNATANEQISAAFIGGGLTSAAAVRISNRINAYMTALSINVY